VLSSVTFGNDSTPPDPTSVIVRLNAFASPAGTSWSTSTRTSFAHAPRLSAVTRSAVLPAATASRRTMLAATESGFGTRTTHASLPPLAKKCETA
jgi:hypothetical protein